MTENVIDGLESKTNLILRVEGQGIRFSAARGRNAAGYVRMTELVDIIEALDRILDKWDGKEMEPATYRVSTSA